MRVCETGSAHLARGVERDAHHGHGQLHARLIDNFDRLRVCAEKKCGQGGGRAGKRGLCESYRTAFSREKM